MLADVVITVAAIVGFLIVVCIIDYYNDWSNWL